MVTMFEEEMADYTGAPYALAIDNCTDALFLCCMYLKTVGLLPKEITIPSRTYLSVPQSIIQSGAEVVFDKREETNNWFGMYQLKPTPIYDSAKRLRRNMYIPETYLCLSFNIKKPLTIGKGGMILTDDTNMVPWIKRARYEGRNPDVYYKTDDLTFCGWNMYMEPLSAARGLALMAHYDFDGRDVDEPNGYRELTEFTLFKNCKTIE